MKKLISILILISVLFPHDIDCVGSSITADGYPETVALWLAQDGYDWNVNNYGVQGAGVVNNPYEETKEFTEVLQRDSEYVVLFLGANDADGFSSQPIEWQDYWELKYRDLIRRFDYGSPKVILGTVLYQIYSTRNSGIDMMNARIKNIANELGLYVIDFNAALNMNPDYFQADGIHPSIDGQYQLAKIAYDYLKTLPTNVRLGIEDDYWEAVRDYEEQRKIGWFGCDYNNTSIKKDNNN